MRVDGFIFLAYDCHIQVQCTDLNPSLYAKVFFTAGLSSLAAPLQNIYMVQHSQVPGYVKGSLTNLSSVLVHLESSRPQGTER